MRKLFSSVALILLVLVSACENDFLPGLSGDGDTVDVELQLNEFSEIDNTIAADLVLTEGNEFSVVVRGQQNIIDNMLTEVKSDEWVIAFDEWVRESKTITIFITLPELKALELSGSGRVYSTNTFKEANKLTLEVSGSGDVDFACECRDLKIEISGSGNIDLAGEAETMLVEIPGSGEVHAYEMDLEEGEVDISGSGAVQIFAADLLNVQISGSGDVYYRGKPRIESSISGSGSIIDDN